MLNSNYQNKRKTSNDKDIIEFFSMIEDKFENNSQKLQIFMDLMSKYNNTK